MLIPSEYALYIYRQHNGTLCRTLPQSVVASHHGESRMKRRRKPDLVFSLVFALGIGLAATSYAQALLGG